MKVLVTGSNGFIGKILVPELERQGHTVFGFDKVLGHNILNTGQVAKAVGGMDAVYHLAASLKENDHLLESVNVFGTKNVLEACAKQKVKQLIFLSTVGVMGGIKTIADEKTPFNPITPYEKSKAKAEELVLEYQEVLAITIVRSALVMGANKEWQEIIKIIKKNFPLIGSGKNYWQIVYSKDLVRALVFLLGKEDATGETFIVAENEPKTLRELVILFRKELGMSEKIKTIPVVIGLAISYLKVNSFLKPEYVKRLVRLRHYSTQKINSLGWKPKYSTIEAVRETVKEIEKK